LGVRFPRRSELVPFTTVCRSGLKSTKFLIRLVAGDCFSEDKAVEVRR
jgi:hypothetical protein